VQREREAGAPAAGEEAFAPHFRTHRQLRDRLGDPAERHRRDLALDAP
jgi:hypothetical protein